jgi:hypothetical protein
MKRISPLILTLGATGAALASPVAHAADAVPTMNFLAAPAVPLIGEPQPPIEHSRRADRMVVVVHEVAACGERLSSPRLALVGKELRLDYESPAPAPGTCVATGVFTIGNLPAEPLVVVAQARSVPLRAPAQANRSETRLTFISAPANHVQGKDRFTLRQAQHGARMVAVISEPAACGSRLQDASAVAAPDGPNLALRYRVVPPAAGEDCTALGVFAVDGLPRPGMLAQAQSEPIFAPAAAATVRTGAPAPTMGFLAAPATPIAESADAAAGRTVMSVRRGDILQVIVREPAPCGARAASASFAIDERRLTIRYGLQKAVAYETPCMAIAMGTFHGLPAGDFKLEAEAQDDRDRSIALAR